jgi:hypothetical protein
MNILENNIKNILNNMKIEIEKKKESEKGNNEHVLEKSENNRYGSCPDFKFVLKSKKSVNKTAISRAYKSDCFNINKTVHFEALVKDKTIKRSNSFTISEETRKKCLRKLRNMMNIRNIESLYCDEIESIDEDEDINAELSKGFSFHPNSSFIFIFEIILIIANLYSFIVIPLKIVKSEDMRQGQKIFDDIMAYLVDIVYILDLISINKYKWQIVHLI